jgi:TetR/AcrR family transcriptional regulator, regulator of biofilm formation and stress response
MPKSVFVPKVEVRGPDRRRKLIEATVRLLVRDGVSGISHRSVSDEVGLPVSATTYYFSTLDELLSATFRAVFEAFIADPATQPHAAEGSLDDEIESLVNGFFVAVTERAESFRVLFELQLVASRRSDWRGHSSIYWGSQIQGVEAQLGVSSDTARAVIALVDGYIVGFLGTGFIPTREQFRSLVTAIVHSEGAAEAPDRRESPSSGSQ